MDFEILALRFELRALDRAVFPPGKAGNVVRGAFGLALKRAAGEAIYSSIFAPSAASGPSGLGDPPRPFVFRAHPLDGKSIAPGRRFHLDAHLFYPHAEWPAAFERAVSEMMAAGIGPAGGRAETTGILRRSVVVPLIEEPASRLTVRFLTPTELKVEGRLIDTPEFCVLFSRIRDRVSTLRALYGPGPLDIDFRGMAGRAGLVRMTLCEVRHEHVERRSSRTGRTHPLGGFTGEAHYEGDLGEFVPYLRAAQWTGVGRQTVWGKGAIEITLPAGP